MILEFEVDTYGVHADIEVRDLAKKAGFKVLSIRESKRLDDEFRPSGTSSKDTLKDCFKRADELSGVYGYSGKLVSNKDLRRIVLLAQQVIVLEKNKTVMLKFKPNYIKKGNTNVITC